MPVTHRIHFIRNIRQLGEFFIAGKVVSALGVFYPWYVERFITKRMSFLQADDEVIH